MNEQELRMTGSGTAMVPPKAIAEEDKPEGEFIDTRFGRVKISRQNPIIFPNGMLGFPEKFEYCLTSFPSEKLAKFRLLQSLDDLSLSFIVLPMPLENTIIDKADMQVGCKDLEIPFEELTMLMVVTVHRQATGVQLSVNARAPIFISTTRRVASQYVFHNNKYNIQHMISM
jgi:flagellar assembly factor FliW